MSLLPWKKEETLPVDTIRHHLDGHYGYIEEPFLEASWAKKLFMGIIHVTGIADLGLMAYNFWRGSYDFSDWMVLFVQIAIGVIYLAHLWNKTSPFHYYQLSPEQFEVKRGFRHQKFKLVNIQSVEYIQGNFFRHTELVFHMKTGETRKLQLSSMFKEDRKKIDAIAKKLKSSIELIHRVEPAAQGTS